MVKFDKIVVFQKDNPNGNRKGLNHARAVKRLVTVMFVFPQWPEAEGPCLSVTSTYGTGMHTWNWTDRSRGHTAGPCGPA